VTERAALAVASGAAVVASAGDLLLLWAAATTRPELGLPAAPSAALVAGGLAGVLAIPLYAVGWAALARAMTGPPPPAHIVRGAGAYGAALGAVIHGMTTLAIAVEQGAGAATIEPLALVERWATFLAPLWALAAVLVVVASWAWARAAWRGTASVPRLLAWSNPAAGTLALGLLGLATPLGRAFLVPAAPNLAHVVFFAATAARPRV
jgi:hypothetical protein